ncbi:hypothetical protein NPIL_691421 [Nephila pilipes]|uniref:Uncharacterized protein n=1 Tax=Nephila pilipes TaxID=299642 RepID=A0A8X6N0N3_NEPPI|nr:hypothetical protein NPIL_691421 [Nephila pilipes]
MSYVGTSTIVLGVNRMGHWFFYRVKTLEKNITFTLIFWRQLLINWLALQFVLFTSTFTVPKQPTPSNISLTRLQLSALLLSSMAICQCYGIPFGRHNARYLMWSCIEHSRSRRIFSFHLHGRLFHRTEDVDRVTKAYNLNVIEILF